MRPVSRAAVTLCIDPLPLDEFLTAYWEQEPCLIRRQEPERFQSLITFGAFDRLAASSNLHYPCFRVFKDGALLPPERLTADRQVGADLDRNVADLDAVYEACADGATLVMQALEKQWPPLTDLCVGLEGTFGAPIQAYAYHTPPGAAGPPAHYDTHEVFVLQVEGSKQWRVWPSYTKLPLRLSEDSYEHDAVIRFAAGRNPIIEHELRSGETLYIPRGFVHAAHTSAGRSLHVSLSVMVWRWLDLFRSLASRRLEQLASDDVGIRHATPFNRQPGTPLGGADLARLNQWTEGLTRSMTLREGVDLMVQGHREICAVNRRSAWRDRLEDSGLAGTEPL
jgi:lysine-specific demethylase/histidyl-hydroxylase NO66